MNNTTDSHAKLVAANDEMARQLIPAMVYLAVLMLLGIVGNLLVCFVFYFRLRMSTQDRLIIALAVFDLLSCFIAMPTEIVDMRYFYMFDSEFACRLLRFIIHYCAFASILTLIVIAVDRYLKVCRPLQRQMSPRKVKMALLLVLLLALLFAFPATILYGIRTTDIDNIPIHGHDCSTNDSVKDTVFPLVYNSVLFLAFFVIFITLTVIYVRIWREMKRHRLYMARNSMPEVGSRFYLSSVSEASSELPHGGRRNTLPGENTNDAVFVESDQTLRDAEGNTVKKAVRNESGSSDNGTDHNATSSVKSDTTTVCEAEVELTVVNEIEQGSENATANTSTQVSEDVTIKTQLSEDVKIKTPASEDVEKQFQHEQNIKIDSDGVPHSNSVNQTEQSTISTTNKGGEGTLTCNCDTDVGDAADSATGERISGPENCNGFGDRACVSSINGTVPQTLSDATADSGDARDTRTDPHRPGSVDSENSLCSGDTAPKRSSQTETDRLSVNDVLKTVAANSLVTRRKVTKSRSVSEVKSHKATIIAMSVTVVFFLSFVPHLSLITVRTIDTEFDRKLVGAGLVLYNIFLRSYFINAVTNPFIYGVLNSRFRSECLHVFRQLVCCRNRVS